jgi:serine/threonine protein kinase
VNNMAQSETSKLSIPKVPGYEILKRIGKGGMGDIYVAKQLTLGRLVALKFLSLDSEFDPDQEMRAARFRREAELMAKVSHPNIVPIFDFGTVEGHPYLVMEYVEGGDLRRLMSEGQPMPIAQVLAIVPPVGGALAYLHRSGILHRDLKPENILMLDGGLPKVTDFGIAAIRANAGSLTRSGHGMGTLGYVAPEQQYGLKVDARADQFSLAALSYELLTGSKPLGIFRPPSQLNPRLDLQVDAAILRGLQENPKDRFATIEGFVSALEQALSAVRPRRRRLPALLALVAAMSLLGVAMRVFWFGGEPGGPPHLPPPGPRPASARTAIGEQRPAPQEKAVATEPSPAFKKLTEIRAREIWLARGSPTGKAGAAAKDEIWLQAEKGLREELNLLAYRIWESRGSPTGEAGEAVKDEIWQEAERKKLDELTRPNGPSEPPRPPND